MNAKLDLTSKVIRDSVRDLEQIAFIPAIDKAHILLVANGDKPSMHTGLFSEPVASDQAMAASDITTQNTLIKIITNLGLKHKIEVRKFEHEISDVPSYTIRSVVCVAKDMRDVEKLYDAREKSDNAAEGLLLGFPESAVNAYTSNNLLAMADHPTTTERVPADEMKLLNHRLSLDNWEEEVDYLCDYACAIKQLSPEIYNQCMSA